MMPAHAQIREYFMKDYLNGQKFLEEMINEEEFNSLVSNKRNILPVHFCAKAFNNLLKFQATVNWIMDFSTKLAVQPQ